MRGDAVAAMGFTGPGRPEQDGMCLDTGYGENQRWGSGGPLGVPWGNTQDRYPGSTLSATLIPLGRGLEGKSPAPSGAARDLSRAVQLSFPSLPTRSKAGPRAVPF